MYYDLYRPKKKLVYIGYNISEIYYYLGFINMNMNNFGKALEYFNNALKWNPVDVTIIMQRAIIFKKMKQYERFRADIEKSHAYIYNANNLGNNPFVSSATCRY